MDRRNPLTRSSRFAYLALALGIVLLAVGPWLVFRGSPRTRASDGRPPAGVDVGGDEPIRPIPLRIDLDARKVTLGGQLFRDRRLSRDDTVSCADCHDLARGGVDGLARARGIQGQVGEINTPTVLNAAFNFRQFWDGRAETLEEQIDGPIHDAKEMASDWATILRKLGRDSGYVAPFKVLYPDGVQATNVKDAIATFERSLITPNSRFDKFLRGDAAALSEEEKTGYRLFKGYGCAACHQGVNAGGNMFQTFGVAASYFKDRGGVTKADLGRFNVTGKEYDRHRFKVPGLRNVALTAPYFHDGSARTLEDAVTIMAKYQLGRSLSSREVELIVKFLRTLTGELPGPRP